MAVDLLFFGMEKINDVICRLLIFFSGFGGGTSLAFFFGLMVLWTCVWEVGDHGMAFLVIFLLLFRDLSSWAR